MSQTLRAVTALVAVLVVGSALAMDPFGWQVFGPLKWVVITVTAWTAGALALGGGTDLHRPSALAWAGFLVWLAFASVMAVDPLSAWIGTPDRRLGFIGVATMAAAYLGGQAVADAAARRMVARATTAAMLAMTAYGIAEAAGWAPATLTTTTDRLGATYGSPAYLGAGLCLFLPITIAAWVDAREHTGWRLGAAAASVGGLFLLAGSGTRAAAVGLVAAVVITGPAWWHRLRPRLVWVVAAGLVVAVVLVLSPLGQRLATSEIGGRLAEWRVGLSVIAEHPVVGVGPEGYRVEFPSHVTPDYVQSYGRSTVTDRVHSGPLDMGVVAGVAGAVAWLAAAGWLTTRAWRTVRSGDTVVTGMAAGLVAVLAQEVFLFPTLEVGVAAWAVAGVVVAATVTPPLRPTRSSMVGGTLAAVAVVVLAVGIADVAADHRAATAVTTGDPGPAEAASRLRPDSFRYLLLASDLAFREESYEEARTHVESALNLSPHDPGMRVARARVVTALTATGDLAVPAALAVVSDAVDRDVNHPELRLLHGLLLARTGQPDEAERAFLAAAHLAPYDPEPHLRLGFLYAALDRPDLAQQALSQARTIDPGHPETETLEELLDAP